MRKYIILLFFFISLPIVAENATNVRVRQEGKTIVITYDLKQRSVVRVYMASGNSTQGKLLTAVIGNVGKGVPAGKSRKIVWHPLDEYENFIAQNVRFMVEAQTNYEYYAHAKNGHTKTLVSAQLGYSAVPQLSYGAMLGQMYDGIGWYAAFRSNFKSLHRSDLSCTADGKVNGEMPFYSGNKHTSHFIINAGFMMDFIECIDWPDNRFNTIGFYVGGGYGKREVQWETTDGLWVRYNPNSLAGFSGNLGVFGSLYGVTLNVGVNTINFKYCELEVGLGFMF